VRAEPTRALSDRITYLAALEEARATIGTGGGAAIDPRVAHRIVDVVEAALLLPERGSMEFEAVAFEDLIETPSARALRYQARARRSASELGAPDSGASDSRAPDGAASPPENTGSRDVERGAAPVIDVGLWLPADVDIATGGDDRGEGVEGNGIGAERRLTSLGRLAWRLALGGASIRLGAGSQTDLEDLLSVVARAQAQEVSRKSVTEQDGEAAWSRITPVVREVDLAGADWIVSAEPPKGAAGDICLSRLARVGGDTPRFVLLGGENSQPRETEDGRLAQGWQGLRLGAHIVEITAIDPVAISALRAARFTPVYVAAPHMGGGTIAQRLQAAYILAGERLAIAGADIARIDTVLRKAGFGDGPFRRLDKAGPAARRALFRAAGRTEGILIREWSGAFYAPQTPDRAPNASTDAMTRPAQEGASTRLAPGVGEALDLLREQRPALRLTDGQIIARVVAELADEAVLMLRIGAVNRPSDIDLIMALDCGMRADMGGPMHMADAIGLLTMRNQLRALTGEGARAPDPLWDVLIKNGRKFSDLNGSARGG
jgi:3-hydroxyacyl-CoA dehydrogenase